jgi:methylenetetrahydrofolate reductase (NADPH)
VARDWTGRDQSADHDRTWDTSPAAPEKSEQCDPLARTGNERGHPAFHRKYYLSVAKAFEIICEIEPATRPDLTRVRHQIGVLSPVANAFLIPDNHIGRSTVSSIAVAHEVQRMGGRSIACVNARDRNMLGFHRDLLTATAYGVNEFLFVYGDRPETGSRSDDLTVRSMITEARQFAHRPDVGEGFRIGVATGLRSIPAWKHEADFLLTQVSFSVEDLVRWRTTFDFDGPVFAGVMVLPSASMARKLSAEVAQLAVPEPIIRRIDADRDAGVSIACHLIEQLRESEAFDGVHLIPVNRYREVASRLESML